ncbi:energy-coupling factor ABC transporter ATP-binding protein [Brassicibacter mesophilus]|uniref:energy-coupling factor ABC transporter ATP-binding protein n=1 Tax=Brassicibacter mesophilus TaxID=745119 RepID=UPI003D25DAB6
MTFPIEIEDLHFRYNGSEREILSGINICIDKGEVVAVVGLSGKGKSTLCYCISGIIPHIFSGNLFGKVRINGISTTDMSVAQIATKLGVVFQDPDTQLFSPTVEDELAFGPENLCLNRDEIGRRIEESLYLVGMQDHRYDNPNQLSGGQKQLISIASVLCLKPDILILDEVMAQVDKDGKQRIKQVIKSLRDEGKTIVMVEHDINNLDIADKVVLLKEGKLERFCGNL